MKDRDQDRSERRKLRAMYKELSTEVAAILYELDPLHITFAGIAPGAPLGCVAMQRAG